MIELLVFAFNQVHAQIHECEVLLTLTNHLVNYLQTRKVTELIFAAVLQGLMRMRLLQSYHFPKTSQTATAQKAPDHFCFGGSLDLHV